MEGQKSEHLPVQYGIIDRDKEIREYHVNVQPAGFNMTFSFKLRTTVTGKADLAESAHQALVRALAYGGAYEVKPI